MVIEEQPAELLSRPEHFPPAMSSPATVSRGQIEELQRSFQGPLEPIEPLRLPRGNRAIHLAADVGKLLGEAQGLPPSRRKVRMTRHGPSVTRDQRGDHRDDRPAQSGIVDAAGAVPLGRADIDHRIELDPLLPVFPWIG